MILRRLIGNRLDEDQMETHVLAKALCSNGCLSDGTPTNGGDLSVLGETDDGELLRRLKEYKQAVFFFLSLSLYTRSPSTPLFSPPHSLFCSGLRSLPALAYILVLPSQLMRLSPKGSTCKQAK